MRWLKTIIGIVLILFAVFAIYYWNTKGVEKAAELETAKLEVSNSSSSLVLIDEAADSRQAVFDRGLSYFSIPNRQIKEKSSLLAEGDFVAVYSYSNKALIGKYEVSAVFSDSLEIICSVEDYFALAEYDYDDLVFVMEDPNG